MDETAKADYGRSWYLRTAIAAPERPPLAVDLDVDACVIGGGLAGLTTARELARLGWSVVLLEAKRVAWNASGRNCGFVLPGFASEVTDIVDRVGLDQAKRLWILSEAGLEYVRNTIRETGMRDVQLHNGWLDVSKVDNPNKIATQVSMLQQDFGATVDRWPTERVRDVLRSDCYFHAVYYPRAFHIHPLNYALGLAQAAEEAGARIFEQTPAIEIDPAGVRKRVLTPAALVRAGQVVLAGNTHIGKLMPKLAETLLPVASTVAVTEPLGERLAEAIAFGGCVSDSRFANHHYRIVDGDRLMWAGGGGTFARDARRVAETFKAAIARTYPQLGEVEIACAWSGTMGFAVHRMPQVGEITPGLWIASAFGGHGINTSAVAGNLVARAIAENDDNWSAFSDYDLVWAGGGLGRAFAEASFRVRNWLEDSETERAQRHDRLRRDREATTSPPPRRTDARDEAPAEPAAAQELAVAQMRAAEDFSAPAAPRRPFGRRRRVNRNIEAESEP